MDSLCRPVLLAALAVSLCSSPALADRKFGKNILHFLFLYTPPQQKGGKKTKPSSSPGVVISSLCGAKSTCLVCKSCSIHISFIKVHVS